MAFQLDFSTTPNTTTQWLLTFSVVQASIGMKIYPNPPPHHGRASWLHGVQTPHIPASFSSCSNYVLEIVHILSITGGFFLHILHIGLLK